MVQQSLLMLPTRMLIKAISGDSSFLLLLFFLIFTAFPFFLSSSQSVSTLSHIKPRRKANILNPMLI